jgi:hypothetical protein
VKTITFNHQQNQQQSTGNKTLLRRLLRIFLIAHALYLIPITVSLASYIAGNDGKQWWELNRESSRQAPDPSQHNEAIIQVYAARAARWRGALGVHSWIAVKPTGANSYTRIEVIGFHLRRYGYTVNTRQRSPDNHWYGSRPELLRELRGGAEIDTLIQRLMAASEQYRYDKRYRLWPGPNSNTFIAWLGRTAPELQLELPVTAVGKDYLAPGRPVSRTPSGTGWQLSVAGVYGLMLAVEEGLEVTLLGFTAGIDFSPFAIKLPGIGRIGAADFRLGYNRPETTTLL